MVGHRGVAGRGRRDRVRRTGAAAASPTPTSRRSCRRRPSRSARPRWRPERTSAAPGRRHPRRRRPLTDADLAALTPLVHRLDDQRPPGVVAVTHDPAGNVARNREVALITATFAGAPEEQATKDATADLRTKVASALRGTDLTAGVTGETAIVLDNQRSIADAERTVTIVTVALIVVLLLLIFRSPLAAALPLLAVGLVLVVSTKLIAAAATVFGFEVGQEMPILLTVVLFGIGTDYLLFLLFRFRERLRAGDEPRDAVVTAVERVGEAISSAALAVIAAFGALVLATMGFFTTLGPALAIGVAVMLLAALTLAPAVLTLLGRRVFWPTRATPRAGTRAAAVGRLVARHPVKVVAAASLLLGGLSAGLAMLSTDYDPIGQLPPGHRVGARVRRPPARLPGRCAAADRGLPARGRPAAHGGGDRRAHAGARRVRHAASAARLGRRRVRRPYR